MRHEGLRGAKLCSDWHKDSYAICAGMVLAPELESSSSTKPLGRNWRQKQTASVCVQANVRLRTE
jgi:hypothetical protein